MTGPNKKIAQTRARKRSERNNKYSDVAKKKTSTVLRKLYKEGLLNMAGIYRKLNIDKNTFNVRLNRCNWLDAEIDIIIDLGISPYKVKIPATKKTNIIHQETENNK